MKRALLLIAVGQALLALPASGEPPAALRVFFFGNSLTGNTMPAWHPALGASAGVQWESHAWLGAGWQLWQHREELLAGEAVFAAGSKGDLTLETAQVRPARVHLEAWNRGGWDAVVLQVFATAVTRETDTMYGRKLGATRDTGDLGAAADLLERQLRRAPATRFFVYQVWPPMDPGEARDGKRGAEFPRRESFEYAQRWLQPYDAKAVSAAGYSHRTRDFSRRIFEGLRQKFPEVAQGGRLRMIPAGDLFLELDRVFRSGAAPGVPDIREFYTDVQHLRAGLPRYAVAALVFACLFERSPGMLDWRAYNDRRAYGPDPHHDIGELLEITAERAAVVHAAIDRVRSAGETGREVRP